MLMDGARLAGCLPALAAKGSMLAKRLLSQVFADDAITRGLGDVEARVLVEWLVERAESLAAAGVQEDMARSEVARLRRRARSISRFVTLWCHSGERGAAGQFAAAERLNWPLPDDTADPCDLMQIILDWEEQQRRQFSRIATNAIYSSGQK